MLRTPLLYLSRQKGIQHLIMRLGFSRRVARRFVAGDTLSSAVDAVRALNASSMRATLDHLGEHVTSADDATLAAAAYLTALNRIAAEGIDSNVSLKLTQMGLDLSPDLAWANVTAIVQAAAARGNFVRIDMEGSPLVGTTLAFYERLRAAGYDNVGVVIQSYLYRSVADVEKILAIRARVRLVKGAYDEPPDVAYPLKRDVDENFLRLAARLLEQGNYPAIATHDEKIINWSKRFAVDRGIGRERFEFQFLYGIRRDLQQQLAGEGYNVRVYVPYGSEWYPYLMRRLAERPENLFFVLSNLFRG